MRNIPHNREKEELYMKKRLLSLALALACCLGLAVPVSAAGTKKVVEDKDHGVKITMNEFLRVESHYYNSTLQEDDDYVTDKPQGSTIHLTLYVVADNSTVTLEALPGRKYGDPILKDLNRWNFVVGNPDKNSPEYAAYQAVRDHYADYALDTSQWFGWDRTMKCFFEDGGPLWPLMEATTYTVSPDPDRNEYGDILEYGPNLSGFEAIWICESDYARLVPAKLQTADWAAEEVTRAYDAGLMPFSPYLVNCAKGMTRSQFAAVTVNLYAAMLGKTYWALLDDVDTDHPFTDVDYDTTDLEYEIGMAYNLGFVKGSNSAGTLFSPKATLTRQEAAVMLGRVFTKLGGTIPAVSSTAFADDKDVGSWAKSEVAFMSGKDIVKGVGDNRFAPTKTLSIQEAVIMANRMLETLR